MRVGLNDRQPRYKQVSSGSVKIVRWHKLRSISSIEHTSQLETMQAFKTSSIHTVHKVCRIYNITQGSHFIRSRSEAKYATSALFLSLFLSLSLWKEFTLHFYSFAGEEEIDARLLFGRDVTFNGGCCSFFFVYPPSDFTRLRPPSLTAI